MLAAIIGIAFIIGYFLLRAIYELNRNPEKDKTTFLSHAAEIRDLIHRCGSLTEWWALDQEIDWLEDTWRGKVDHQLMLETTGKLYQKWHNKRGEIENKKTA
jgi:hypothetical protein